MIIDTHTHFYDPTRPQGVPWPPAENKLLYRPVLPDHFTAVAAPHGVTATVVVEASAWPADNQWILELVDAHPPLLGFVGHVDPDQPTFAADLAQWVQHPRFCGIRCGGRYFADIHAGTFLQDMATLAAHDRQLDVLVRQEHFAGVIALAAQLPTLRIVIDHIGHMPIDGAAIAPEWIAHYQRLAAQPNIWMKVSAVIEQSTVQPAPTTLDFYRPALDTFWQSFGADRLLYGSNWPVVERAGTYATAFQIVQQYFTEKGEAAYAKYFWANAQQVYRLNRSRSRRRETPAVS
jgi:L-fuconolactonase